MSELRRWIVYSWFALPTVMYGGYMLRRLITRSDAATPLRLIWFRAGHAHAGLLLLMSRLYYAFIDKTTQKTIALFDYRQGISPTYWR